MFIRSTLLITLVSVGVAGCQGRSNTSAPVTTASVLGLGNAKTAHTGISQSFDSEIPAPVPTVTASAPSPQPMEVSDGELRGLTVQPYPNAIPAPAPVAGAEIEESAPRRGLLAPIGSAVGRIAGLSSNAEQQTGRTFKLGRKVIASRSRSKTHRIIVEDDLTNDNYELDTGDRIRVSVFEQRNLSRIYTVDAGGFISVPLIGSISVRGETTSMVERSIANSLSQKYIKDPKVSVEINTYRPFYILGQVRNSGSFPFVNGMTVRSAVAVAGGYTARANKRKVMLTRRLNKKRITTYVQPGYYIRPGDTLEIRERFF